MSQPGSKRRRFRPIMMLLVLAIIAAAILYPRCGGWLGLGPGGGGDGGGKPESGVDRGPAGRDRAKQDDPELRPAVGGVAGAGRRCQLRLDASGLTLDNQPSTVESAVEACKRAGSAELTTTGDALFGEHERVTRALERAGVEVFVRDPSR